MWGKQSKAHMAYRSRKERKRTTQGRDGRTAQRGARKNSFLQPDRSVRDFKGKFPAAHCRCGLSPAAPSPGRLTAHVARREPAQHALGTLYSLDKVSRKADRARAGRLGRDGALNATMTTSSPIGSPAAGLRGALLDGRLLSNLSTVSLTSLLSLQPPTGAGAGRLASPALPMVAFRAKARGARDTWPRLSPCSSAMIPSS